MELARRKCWGILFGSRGASADCFRALLILILAALASFPLPAASLVSESVGGERDYLSVTT
jgi:hypothetical protein